MIDPQAILLQVEQGQTPTAWRVFKGKDFRFAQGILGGAFIFLFLFILILGVGERFLHFHLFFSTFPRLSPFFPYLIGGIAVVAVIYGSFSWSKAAQERDSILVLTPDGLLQCTQYHLPEKRTYKILSYSDIRNMIFRRIDASTAMSGNRYLISVKYAIDIAYKDGYEEQWILDKRFGYPNSMAQIIIKEYENYRTEQSS